MVEGCASGHHLIGIASEGLHHHLTDALLHLLVDYGHIPQQSHLVVLYLREYHLANNLLDDKRYGDDNLRAHVGECLCDDGRRGYAGEIIDMATIEELEDKLECHTVHVGHGQDADDTVAMVDGLAKHMHGEVVVAP